MMLSRNDDIMILSRRNYIIKEIVKSRYWHQGFIPRYLCNREIWLPDFRSNKHDHQLLQFRQPQRQNFPSGDVTTFSDASPYDVNNETFVFADWPVGQTSPFRSVENCQWARIPAWRLNETSSWCYKTFFGRILENLDFPQSCSSNNMPF